MRWHWPTGRGSGRERLLGLAPVKEYNGAADFPDVVTEPGLANPMSGLTVGWKRKQRHKSLKLKDNTTKGFLCQMCVYL